MRLNTILIILFFSLLGQLALAQNGTIRGTIIDDETGEELIGATVAVVGGGGAVTDLDGNYTLPVAPGTYDLQVSYVSYATQKITGVEVKAGQVTQINVRLKEDSEILEAIVVEAKALQNSESALLTIQKKASVVLDGISSEQFSRIGDNDAASAVRRVTGVNVEGGRYIYVRGLGDRYAKTTINGGEVSGLDPNRNTVQMDLFPTALLDNVVVYKTFSPDLYGDFTGGYVDIATKDFPETLTVQASLSVGYNTQATFNDEFLTHSSTGAEWLTFPGEGRDIPDIVRGGIVSREASVANLLRDQTLAFESFEVEEKSPMLNTNFSFSFGNQYELFGRPFGLIVGLNHQRNFESYTPEEEGEANIWIVQGTGEDRLLADLRTSDSRSVENALLGGLINLSYKITSNNKVSFNLMRNQSTQKEARRQIGVDFTEEVSSQYNTRRLDFQERNLTTSQLKGTHNISAWNNFEIEWLASYSKAEFDQPDLRFLTWEVRENGAARWQTSTGLPPSHFFRDMIEDSYNGKLDFTLPFSQWNGLKSKLKFGSAYLYKEREYREEIYQLGNAPLTFENNDFSNENNILTNLYSSDNIDSDAVAIEDNSQLRNSYDANQNVLGVYLMVELPLSEKLKVITGARYERTEINFTSFVDIDGSNVVNPLKENEETTLIENNDILPSLNVVYNLKKDMNFRVAYNRTLARPTFRELSPAETFDFVGSFLQRGNTDLKRTLVDNVDLRWEYYTRPGEIFSVSAFYKRFQDPIEPFIDPDVNTSSGDLVQSWANLADSDFYGLEFEARKRLDFITPALKDFTLGANFTYVYTVVELTPGQVDFVRANNSVNTDTTRPLSGQAPWVVNAALNYQNNDIGLKSGLIFYMNGTRLSTVDIANNHIFEQPRPNLRFNISKDFGRINVRFSAANLLNPEFLFDTEYNGENYIFQNSRVGRTFSIRVKYLFEK